MLEQEISEFFPDLDTSQTIETKKFLTYKQGKTFMKLKGDLKLYYQVKTMLSWILITPHLSNLRGFVFIRKPLEMVENIRNKYSKLRFNQLLSDKAFSIIFHYFVQNGGVEFASKWNELARDYEEAYRKKIHELLVFSSKEAK